MNSDVGFLLYSGEGFHPDHLDPRFSLIELAVAAERNGFSTIGVVDHLRWQRPEGPHGFWESTTVLGALAAATSSVRLTTAVLNMPFRNPALVAKIAETLDFLSNGRFALGVGSGGGPDIEYESFGFDFDNRHARFVEALQIITGLLRNGAVDFEGTYYRASECVLRPRGPHPDGLPIIIGAEGPKMLRLAAQYADEWNGITFQTATPTQFAPMVAAVERACEDVGRDPQTLRRSIDIAVAPTTSDDPELPGFGPPLHGRPAILAAQLVELSDLNIDEIRTYLWPQTMESIDAMGEVIAELAAM